MLKELFEGHFYGTFPKVADRIVNLTEYTLSGSFSLLDQRACRDCHFICNADPSDREQLKVDSTVPVHTICLDDVFSYVKEELGETSDYMLEGGDTVVVVEMTCSTSDYVIEKRKKARRQLYNTLTLLMMSPVVREHVERLKARFVVFSWRETFDDSIMSGDPIGESMTGMALMVDEVYSPDNESKFDFGFKLKEIRYPYAFLMN